MSIDKIVDDIAAHLKAELTELKTSELAGGKIDLVEMRRRAVHLPAAFVACVRTRGGSSKYGKFSTRGIFLVVLVVESGPGGQATPQDHAHAVLQLLTRALKVIGDAKTWGNDEVVSTPDKIDSDNPYNKKADENGVALWVITWEQDLELAADPAPDELDDLEKILATWELQDGTTPATDATDEITP